MSFSLVSSFPESPPPSTEIQIDWKISRIYIKNCRWWLTYFIVLLQNLVDSVRLHFAQDHLSTSSSFKNHVAQDWRKSCERRLTNTFGNAWYSSIVKVYYWSAFLTYPLLVIIVEGGGIVRVLGQPLDLDPFLTLKKLRDDDFIFFGEFSFRNLLSK